MSKSLVEKWFILLNNRPLAHGNVYPLYRLSIYDDIQHVMIWDNIGCSLVFFGFWTKISSVRLIQFVFFHLYFCLTLLQLLLYFHWSKWNKWNIAWNKYINSWSLSYFFIHLFFLNLVFYHMLLWLILFSSNVWIIFNELVNNFNSTFI